MCTVGFDAAAAVGCARGGVDVVGGGGKPGGGAVVGGGGGGGVVDAGGGNGGNGGSAGGRRIGGRITAPGSFTGVPLTGGSVDGGVRVVGAVGVPLTGGSVLFDGPFDGAPFAGAPFAGVPFTPGSLPPIGVRR